MNLHTCLAVSMPGLGEMLPILVIVIILFGAKRIPDLARSLGKSLSEFKKGREEGLNSSDSPDDAEKNGDTKNGDTKNGNTKNGNSKA